jgi:hypothetical protein
MLPDDNKPKMYVATNHALMGEGPSFFDRLALLAFSDYYNDNHKPIDEFGKNFFSEWVSTQWNLFYNLMGTCLQLFLKYRFIVGPHEELEMRRLRQMIGEELLAWLDEYFSDILKLNTRIPRKELYEAAMNTNPNLRKYVSTTRFKKKLKAWCKFREFTFNPMLYDERCRPISFDKNNRPIESDKSNGIEYFTIADHNYSPNNENDGNSF